MMNCNQARQLFDAFIDGELSVSLATELGAHRVNCADCRRALALLEVAGHIIATDEDSSQLKNDFTDRLLACVDKPIGRWNRLMRRTIYIGGPMAAAAVVALAFLGVFDRSHESHVLSEREVAPETTHEEDESALFIESEFLSEQTANPLDKPDDRWDEWLQEAQRNIDAKRLSGESLQHMLDLTVVQWLDIIEQAKRSSLNETPSPKPTTPAEKAPTGRSDVEDL